MRKTKSSFARVFHMPFVANVDAAGRVTGFRKNFQPGKAIFDHYGRTYKADSTGAIRRISPRWMRPSEKGQLQ